MKRLLFMWLALAMLAGAAQDLTMTWILTNGNYWNGLSERSKPFYVDGVRDMLVLNSFVDSKESSKVLNANLNEIWATPFTVGDYIRVLDGLYSQPENALIPIVIAMRYGTYKLKGDHSAKEVEDFLLDLRIKAKELFLWGEVKNPKK